MYLQMAITRLFSTYVLLKTRTDKYDDDDDDKITDRCTVQVNQSRYRAGVAQRVPGS